MLLLLSIALAADPSPFAYLDAALDRARSLMATARKDDAACIKPKIDLMEGIRPLIRPIDLERQRAADEGNQLHVEAAERKMEVVHGKIEKYLAEAEACIEVQSTNTSVGDPAPTTGEELLTAAEPPPDTPCVSCF